MYDDPSRLTRPAWSAPSRPRSSSAISIEPAELSRRAGRAYVAGLFHGVALFLLLLRAYELSASVLAAWLVLALAELGIRRLRTSSTSDARPVSRRPA